MTRLKASEGIALSEIYRGCFKESLQNEIATAINEELVEIVQENNEVAENVIETVAVAYAKTVAKPQIKPLQVKLLKPFREEECQGSNVQALLPMRKARAKAIYNCTSRFMVEDFGLTTSDRF